MTEEMTVYMTEDMTEENDSINDRRHDRRNDSIPRRPILGMGHRYFYGLVGVS